MHVLIADDQADTRQMIELALKRRHHQATLVKNGAQAVQAIEDSDANPFDVIVMDEHMPVMNGLTAIRRIRALPAGQTVPIMLLSAYAFVELEARQAGADLALQKPMSPIEVVELLEAVLCKTS